MVMSWTGSEMKNSTVAKLNLEEHWSRIEISGATFGSYFWVAVTIELTAAEVEAITADAVGG
jgi:hypothetical protein